jgi:hypothetical protein
MRGTHYRQTQRHQRPATAVHWLLVVTIAVGMMMPLAAQRQVSAHGAHGDLLLNGEGPPSEILIRDDLAAGKIDYPTSLILRAYAVFGDPRLPEAYAGSGSLDDAMLFAEVNRNWDVLPEATKDRLTPFLVRPTDPRSIFHTPGGPAAPADFDLTVMPDAGVDVDARASAGCSDDWAWKNSARFDLKVWTHCDGDYKGDLVRALELFETLWEKQVAIMGPPLPDSGGPDAGGDSRLDVYFVDAGKRPPRDEASEIDDRAAAYATIDARSKQGKAAAGFIVSRRERLYDPGQAATLAHEFYHVLQFAHNWDIGFGYSWQPYGRFDILTADAEYWFLEAMANWAISYVYRDRLPPVVLQASLHNRYLEYFQPADVPLYHSPEQWGEHFLHMYGAYVWFLFVELKVGPERVAQIWEDMEQVEQDDWDGALAVINDALPFEEHFRDFAVMNLNLDLEPGDPVSPSFADIDPIFPVGIRPPLIAGEGADRRIQPGEARTVEDAIPQLRAHYAYFVPQEGATGVTLDFTGLVPSEAVDVDLIVNIEGKGWERRQLDPAKVTTLCRDKPADNVKGFYLVISNHDVAARVEGNFSVTALDAGCR